MKFLLIFLILTFLDRFAYSAPLSPDQFDSVGFEQRLGEYLPMNTVLSDENCKPVRLGSLFGEKPAIFVMAYYDCPNLCTLVLDGLVSSLRDLRATAGSEFTVITVSIRPNESADKAREKKRVALDRYGRSGTDDGWHFLTGDESAIHEISTKVGFNYVYDPSADQYAHPSGIVILTPAGQISKYLFGIEYSPKELSSAISAAQSRNVGTLSERLLLLCFHYDPATGRYSLLISRVIQIFGVTTVIVLAGLLVWLRLRERRNSPSK